MLLVFTLPGGLFLEQHAKIGGEWEEMAVQVLRAESAAWQRLARGRFLGAFSGSFTVAEAVESLLHSTIVIQ